MNYEQKVVWVGTVLGDSSVEDFEDWFLSELEFHVKFVEEFEMVNDLKGIHCIVFSICSKEIPKFALFRITTNDMKWLEDFWDNEFENIPEDIYKKYRNY